MCNKHAYFVTYRQTYFLDTLWKGGWDILIIHFDETFSWDILMGHCHGWKWLKIVHSITRLVIKLLICTTGLSNIPQRDWHWLPWPCFVMRCTKPPSTHLKLFHILEENYRYPPNCMGNSKRRADIKCLSHHQWNHSTWLPK